MKKIIITLLLLPTVLLAAIGDIKIPMTANNVPQTITSNLVQPVAGVYSVIGRDPNGGVPLLPTSGVPKEMALGTSFFWDSAAYSGVGAININPTWMETYVDAYVADSGTPLATKFSSMQSELDTMASTVDMESHVVSELATMEASIQSQITSTVSGLATVASTGSYTDLSNKPTIFSGNYAQLTNVPMEFMAKYHTHELDDITDLISILASKAETSTLSNYLLNSNFTWTNISGKPTTVSSFTNDANYVTSSGLTTALGSYATSSSLAGYVTSSSLATTLGSYPTSSSLTSTLGNYALTSSVTSGLASKFNNPSGTTLQYLRGDGSVATFPTIPTIPSLVTVSVDGLMSASDKVKLNGIAPLATANSSDATLLARANHTGTQAVSTITGLATVATTGSYNDLSDKPSIPTVSVPVINNNPGRTLITSTAATGFQVSSTKYSDVRYNVSTTTTATIGGPSSGDVVLETATTNSTTPSDWTIIDSSGNTQTITLAVVLNSVQVVKGTIGGVIPPGNYVRIRSVTNSGTPSFSYIRGQEVTR